MIFAGMTSTQWASIGIIAFITILVWAIVIFFLLPKLEARLERRQLDKKKEESRKRARRIRVDSGKAKFDFNKIIDEGSKG